MTLCTLFNVNYIDKGLTLYESLENVSKDFVLYVLAMDDKCYEILSDLNYKYLKPIRLADFEDEELLAVKSTRGFGEYCWTCSSSLILYILKTYQPNFCTYLDADLYFYSDPITLIQEMIDQNASVQIIGHRFPWYDKERESRIGKYCVEFDTFKNDKNAISLLNQWREQCLECCSTLGDGIHWGDQKYQDTWCKDFPFVIETKNLGAGIAPWNIVKYKHVSENGMKVKIADKIIPIVFYHFENLTYIHKTKVKLNVFTSWGVDVSLVVSLYLPYLKRLDFYKDLIKEKYGMDILIKKHPALIKNTEKKKFWDRVRHFYRVFVNGDIVRFFMHKLPTKKYYSKDIITL